MTFTDILNAVAAWPVSDYIRGALLAFPLLESAHVVFLTLVFGTILIVDLRLLGVASINRAFGALESDIIKWTWFAFAGAVLTGALMFITNPTVYFENVPFRIKMVLLLCAGLNMLIFERFTRHKYNDFEGVAQVPRPARIAAVLSLVLWTGVIGAGRVIGFTTSHVSVALPPAAANVDFDDFLASDAPAPAPAQ